MKYVVFISRTIKILISNWPWTRFSELLQAGKRFWLFSPWSEVGQDLRVPTIFMLWFVKIWWGEFMRKIYAASWNWIILAAEADRVLCQIAMFLTVFSLWMYKMKYSCHKFIGFLVDKCATCQSWKSNFGWHHFRFSPCLMRKRVKRSQAILTLLNSFQEQHPEW